MARIRTIKPEFWTSEQVVECSMPARLLFVGLWNFCDDAGRHPASYRRIKMEVFPNDAFSPTDIEGWMQELIDNGLIISYIVADKGFWQVTGWHHQKIDKPTVRYPAPENGGAISTTIRLPVGEPSPPERSVRERSVRESSTRYATLRTAVGKLDWEEVRRLALSQIGKVDAEPNPENRLLIYAATAMVTLGILPEMWFVEPITRLAERQKKRTRRIKRPMAWLTKVLGKTAEEHGHDFHELRGIITVPDWLVDGKPEEEKDGSKTDE